MFGARVVAARKGPLVTDVIFTTSQNWTVPAGVTSINIVCIGRGGTGAGGAFNPTENEWNSGGGGGGGGLAYLNSYSVTPGQVYTIDVNGGVSGIKPQGGSYFLYTYDGGNGFNASSSNGGAGGAGGAPGAGGTNFTGGAGGYGETASFFGGGQGGQGGSTAQYTANGNSGAMGTPTYGTGRSVYGDTPGGGTLYGAGGPGGPFGGSAGVSGAVRIMWGAGKSFPNNAGT